MYRQYRPAHFNQLPVVVKNLLIINTLFFISQFIFQTRFGDDKLTDLLGLHYPLASDFHWYQFITYQFLHGDFWHIFFNMFAVWFFGYKMESVWGAKRFLIFYLTCGIGAALIHMGWIGYQLNHELVPVQLFLDKPEFSAFQELKNAHYFERMLPKENWAWIQTRISDVQHLALIGDNAQSMNAAVDFSKEFIGEVYNLHRIIGASGSLFGILIAFALLFPNTEIVFFGTFFPIKAKYFVAIYGIMELWQAMANNPGDYVAHVAHLGGMVFGFILVKIYQRDRSNFY